MEYVARGGSQSRWSVRGLGVRSKGGGREAGEGPFAKVLKAQSGQRPN